MSNSTSFNHSGRENPNQNNIYLDTSVPKNDPQLKRSKSEEEDNGSRPTKRSRSGIQESDMPWFEQEASTTVDPSCLQSRHLLQLYRRNTPFVLFSIKMAASCPEIIPTSQWERILKGDAVDLGRILSNVHPTSVHELPPRPILTSSDWITAWETAESAIKFAFPNRAAELRGYKKHILVLFGIKNVSEYHNIIRYDVGVRRYVEGGQRILLTEFNKFTHLHMVFLLPNGVEYLAPDLSGERGENRG